MIPGDGARWIAHAPSTRRRVKKLRSRHIGSVALLERSEGRRTWMKALTFLDGSPSIKTLWRL